MIALKRKLSELATKREALGIGMLFLLLCLILKIAFFKEGLASILRMSISLFWLFVLPGYFATLYWKVDIGLMERIALGCTLSAGFIGIASYYLGLAGINIKYHLFILPVLLAVCGIIFWYVKKTTH